MSVQETIPVEQQRIRDTCFHPTGTFVEFEKSEIEQSISQRFERQVRMHPDRTAVKVDGRHLTYTQLNAAANGVAHAILGLRGEGPEHVAVLLGGGLSMIPTLLGVLKAGKSYVPLDPSYPDSRTRYMHDDSEAKLIVTDTQQRSRADDLARDGCQVLDIDGLAQDTPCENPGLSVPPTAAAFMLYTSGSTGQPKGFCHDHRNVLFEIMNYTNAVHFCPEDRLTQLASYSFGGSVRNIYGALLNGAALHGLNIKRDGTNTLAEWLVREEITVYRSVETLFYHFASSLTGGETFPDIRVVYLGGEPVYVRDVELFKAHFPRGCVLVNGLGTSESLTFRWLFIDHEMCIEGSRVPVGYPIEGKDVRLIDESGRGVGFDQIGEITVESDYLADGYWRNPEATKAAFISGEGGTGLYRTGDIGLMSPDGLLLHLGRKDFQVKIRGHRIEVAEIEAALIEHVHVREAIVVSRPDQRGEERLVAYFVPAGDRTPTTGSLRKMLAERLPDYMIPSAFVALDGLPRTPSGKVDRRGLPHPDWTRPVLDAPLVPPRSPIEEALVRIWSEVLGIDPIGVHDEFLDLGGHSLLATQVISRVVDAFRTELPVKAMFESPTVADMARVIVEVQSRKAGQEDVERILRELDTLSDEQVDQLLAHDE